MDENETGIPAEDEESSEETPSQGGGAISRLKDEGLGQLKQQATKNLAKQATSKVAQAGAQKAVQAGATTAVRSALVAFGPEIIAGLLALLAIIVGIAAIAFIISAYNGDNGTYAGAAKIDPQNSATDKRNLQDISCLNEAAKQDKDGNGTLPPACEAPIKAWGAQVVTNAQGIKDKISPNEKGGPEAITLLTNLITAANKTQGVTNATQIKAAQAIRDEIVAANNKANANANALIIKYRGFSASAQKVYDYVLSKGQKTNQGGGKPGILSDCRGMSEAVLRAVFGASNWDDGGSANIPGYDPTDNAPSQTAIQATRNILLKGDIPIWHIAGENSGKHFVVVLNIDSTDTFTIYDPDGGRIRVLPSNYPGPSGKEKYFFGSPYAPWIGRNAEIRGLVFPASSFKALDNPGDPIAGR